MSFRNIKNNDYVIGKIGQLVRSGRVPHAFIIESQPSLDKEAFAMDFAKALLCKELPGTGCDRCPVCRKIMDGNHLDITFVEATAKGKSKVKSIKNEDIEKVISRLGQKPFEGDRNIAIIKDADTITPAGLNTLLKTLEEPAPGTVIMLLTDNINNLLPTVVSRCVHFRLNASDELMEGEAYSRANELCEALRQDKPYYEIKDILDAVGKDRDEALELLDAMEQCYGQRLKGRCSSMERAGIYKSISTLEQARDRLKRKEDVAYTLKELVLTIGG